MKTVYKLLGCIISFIFLITSCQKETTTATKIVLASEKIAVGVGRSEPIYASPFPDSEKESKLTWSSDNESIAKIDQNGLVTGVSIGSTYVNVSIGTLSASVQVDVFEPLTDIILDPALTTLDMQIIFGAAESKQFTYSPAPASSSETIIWTTSNQNVASVTSTGMVTAVSAGSALITVAGSGGTVKKEIQVTVTKTGDDPVMFDRTKFARQILPGDNYLDRSEWWYIEGIWDGNRESAGGSSCSLPGPQAFTFDMGITGNLAYFHLFTWKSMDEGYPPFSEANVKKFEVWGSETLDATGSWASWTKLMDCEVIKPSGLPLMQYNNADVQASNDGQKFYNLANYDVKVRYIRVKILETWEGVPCWRISEIELYGNSQ